MKKCLLVLSVCGLLFAYSPSPKAGNTEKTVGGNLNLSLLYEFGDRAGIDANAARAFTYLRAALNPNLGDANEFNMDVLNLRLAEFYHYGFGAPKDDAKALQILTAIKDRSDDANAFYAWLLFWGVDGVTANPTEAVKIWMSLLDKQQKGTAGRAFLNPYAFHGLAIAFQDGRGVVKSARQVALFRQGSMVVSDPRLPAEWLSVKFNALGYLDKKCRSGAFVAVKEDYGRYKAIFADAMLAVAKCMPKPATPQAQREITRMIKEAADLRSTAVGR